MPIRQWRCSLWAIMVACLYTRPCTSNWNPMFVCLFSSLGALMPVMMGRLMWKCCLCLVVFYFCVFFIFITDFSGLPWKQWAYSNMRKSHESCMFLIFVFLYVFVFVIFYILSERKHKCDSCGCSEVLMWARPFASPCSLTPGAAGRYSGWQVRLLGSHVCGMIVVIIKTEIETDQRSDLWVVMLRYRSSHSLCCESTSRRSRVGKLAVML